MEGVGGGGVKRVYIFMYCICYTAHSMFVSGMPAMQAVKYHVLTTNGVFHIYNELCFKCTQLFRGWGVRVERYGGSRTVGPIGLI